MEVVAQKHFFGMPPADRSYHCKAEIFGTILRLAADAELPMVIDGSNASDDAGDRPGMAALAELQVRSPLREAGLTKAEIRELSRAAMPSSTTIAACGRASPKWSSVRDTWSRRPDSRRDRPGSAALNQPG